MRQPSFTASVLVCFLRSAFSAIVTFLGPSWDGPVRKYRPEQHYMRGRAEVAREEPLWRLIGLLIEALRLVSPRCRRE
jgi:hypothetical protein